jgi:tRNA-binding protein
VETLEQIGLSDFQKVDIRIGRVERVEEFPEARKPAYKLWINFGELGIRKSSAQITNYTKESLTNRLVVAVVNFPPRQVADFRSEVLVLGAAAADGRIILLGLDDDDQTPLGAVVC